MMVFVSKVTLEESLKIYPFLGISYMKIDKDICHVIYIDHEDNKNRR
jgi:uncharacterized pyridoxamine 5'-phosphate oxidase family protein